MAVGAMETIRRTAAEAAMIQLQWGHDVPAVGTSTIQLGKALNDPMPQWSHGRRAVETRRSTHACNGG